MAEEQRSVSIKAAQNLITTVKTKPWIPSMTPRWLLKILPWINIETGVYRVNRVKCWMDDTQFIKLEYDKNGEPTISEESLKRFYLFKHLPESVLQTLAKQFKVHKTKPEEEVIQEGTKGDNFYIVASGDFNVQVKGRHGKDQSIKTLNAGDFFGEMSLLENIPRQASVVSLTDGLLFYLTRKAFEHILKDPQIRETIEHIAYQRQSELQNYTQFGEKKVKLKACPKGEALLPNTFIEYEEDPEEIHLSSIQTRLGINTRISDIYNSPYNQWDEQVRVTSTMMLEKTEWEIINNKEFGLLHKAKPKQTLPTRRGPPTPDDLDSLLATVWKKPSCFIAHPLAIAAFGRECTLRGVPPPTMDFMGGTFITWRGVPLIPTEHLEVNHDATSSRLFTTNILLLRLGEEDQGVVGLYKNDLANQVSPGLAVQFMGVDERSVANYLLTKYFSIAVLVPDAIGILKEVEIGNFHDE